MKKNAEEVAVIGAGWYGCHIAHILSLANKKVTLFETHDSIFKGTSGKLGIRLHAGPHYPRSEKTRKNCREGYAKFIETYPDLIVEHAYSIYALGTRDANDEPPKVDVETFRAVAKEVKNSREIEPKKWGYKNLQAAFDVEEPSILLGKPLREKFEQCLHADGVQIKYQVKVHKLQRLHDNKILVIGEGNLHLGTFDHIVNTTSYHSLLPSPTPSLPFDLNIFYQPCLALVYEDRLSKMMSLPPFSFIVMDGWFPCIMPYITSKEDSPNSYRQYILTHGQYTIMGSYPTADQAYACLNKIDEKFITTHVQPKCEAEMERFWPLFGASMSSSTERRFQYVGWKSAVLPKVKTNREFRSAITFAKDGVVQIVPGKVSDIFSAGKETLELINKENVLQQGAYQYVKNGVLDAAVNEITEVVDPTIKNTCNLQTYDEITRNINKSEKATSSRFSQAQITTGKKSTQWLSCKDMRSPNSASFFATPLKNLTSKSLSDTSNCDFQIRSSL